MPRLHYISPDNSAWLAARISAPLAVPSGLGETAETEPAGGVLLLPVPDSGAVLLSKPGSGVRINGEPVPAGLRVLSDRDEIRLQNARFYFSSQDPLIVETLTADAAACPRCSGMIETGTPAVRCHCGVWFHQSAEHPCFTYGETCPLCGTSSHLDADPWNPSSL